MSISALQARWRTAEGGRLAAASLAWLFGNGPPPRVGHHEGRVDLRGLSVPSPSVVRSEPMGALIVQVLAGLRAAEGRRWSSIDLSGAVLPSLRFWDLLVEDCSFERVQAPDWRLWGVEFADCSFVRADLRSSALGTDSGPSLNSWTRVNFDRANLGSSFFRGGTVEGCSFRGTRLRDVEFLQVALRGCVFAGPIAQVLFDGRALPGRSKPSALIDVDFSQCLFEDVDFRGCHFEGVTWPVDVRLIPNYPLVARRLRSSMAGREDTATRMLVATLDNPAKLPGDDQSTGVFVRADWARAGGQELADFAEEAFFGRRP